MKNYFLKFKTKIIGTFLIIGVLAATGVFGVFLNAPFWRAIYPDAQSTIGHGGGLTFEYGNGYGSLGRGYGYGYGYGLGSIGYYQGNETFTITDPSTEMQGVARLSGSNVVITQSVKFQARSGMQMASINEMNIKAPGRTLIGEVTLPEGLIIEGINTEYLRYMSAREGEKDGLTSPITSSVEFGIESMIPQSNDPKIKDSLNTLFFSKPIQVKIVVDSSNSIYPRIKHYGGTRGIDGLTTNPNASCTNGLPGVSDRITLATTLEPEIPVSTPNPTFVITIYTCSASTISATTSYTAPRSTGGGGGGSSKDNCPNGDFSKSYYDGKCGEKTNTETESTGKTNKYSNEIEDAYKFAFKNKITTMPNIEEANMDGVLIRSHTAKMIVNYAINILGKKLDTGKKCVFNDISNESDEMKDYILKACQLGIMGVNTKKFEPNGIVTRGDSF